MTHELRTPLAIIRGEAEAIADGVHTPDAESLGRIIEATAVVERLVADLGVLSAGEPGELRLRKEEVDLGMLITETAGSLQGSAQAAGIELSRPRRPAWLRGWTRSGSVACWSTCSPTRSATPRWAARS